MRWVLVGFIAYLCGAYVQHIVEMRWLSECADVRRHCEDELSWMEAILSNAQHAVDTAELVFWRCP